MTRLTLDQVEAMDKEVLTPAEVSGILHLDQETIRWQARAAPHLLGFPVVVAGNRTKIPRVAFLKYMRGELK